MLSKVLPELLAVDEFVGLLIGGVWGFWAMFWVGVSLVDVISSNIGDTELLISASETWVVLGTVFVTVAI